MIDLEKEREAFMRMSKDQKANIENISQVEEHFKTWCLRAELAQAEINKEREQATEYYAECEYLKAEITELKQKLARYENPDYVLVPRIPTDEMLVGARDWSYKKYGKPVGNDGANGCYKAMIKAVEKNNG